MVSHPVFFIVDNMRYTKTKYLGSEKGRFMKKIDLAANFLASQVSRFKCPVCQQAYTTVQGHSIICSQHHQLDLNKKGTLNFLMHPASTEYDDAMLADRRRVLTAGLFDGIIEAVAQSLPKKPQTMLDVGTGEGTPLAKLLALRSEQADIALGFDISKAGINLASQLKSPAFFLTADLAHLPFVDQSFDSLVEFFSPSAYAEFSRVLKPGGQVVKVVPAAGYLRELREQLYPSSSPQHTYSNQAVVDRFFEHYPSGQMQAVQYDWPIPTDLYQSLLHMTPLHWGARQEAQVAAEQTPLKSVTVDVVLLTATEPGDKS